MSNRELPGQILAEIEKYQDRWPYLRAGLFGGSLERLREVKTGFDAAAERQKFDLGFA